MNVAKLFFLVDTEAVRPLIRYVSIGWRFDINQRICRQMTHCQHTDGFPLQVFTEGGIDKNDIESLMIAVKKLFGRGLHEPGARLTRQAQALS